MATIRAAAMPVHPDLLAAAEAGSDAAAMQTTARLDGDDPSTGDVGAVAAL